ncbi:MAG: chorismate mutase [Polyangiales bacterium]
MPGPPAQASSLAELVDVAARRVLVADLVAAAKLGTVAPIDDPVREQAVLDDVRARAGKLGIDAEVAVAVFRDQIEANKLVQRGLHARWAAHPELAPTDKPDLVAAVRPQLDEITVDLLEQLRTIVEVRATPHCGEKLARSMAQVKRARQFDALHGRALKRAVASVCRVR